jgi:hypothetical protein
MKLSEIVQEVIRLAEAASPETDRRRREPGRAYDLRRAGLARSEATARLRHFLDGQSVAMIYLIILINYYRRGIYPVGDFQDGLDGVRGTFGRLAAAVDYIVWRSKIHDCLARGLALLAEAGIEVDKVLD